MDHHRPEAPDAWLPVIYFFSRAASIISISAVSVSVTSHIAAHLPPTISYISLSAISHSPANINMDMGSSADNSTMEMATMVPYFHFTGGDFLFFKSITPSSKGAIAGAAIFLFFLAMLDRFTVFFRASLEAKWNKRSDHIIYTIVYFMLK
jgi:hypothetical protein